MTTDQGHLCSTSDPQSVTDRQFAGHGHPPTRDPRRRQAGAAPRDPRRRRAASGARAGASRRQHGRSRRRGRTRQRHGLPLLPEQGRAAARAARAPLGRFFPCADRAAGTRGSPVTIDDILEHHPHAHRRAPHVPAARDALLRPRRSRCAAGSRSGVQATDGRAARGGSRRPRAPFPRARAGRRRCAASPQLRADRRPVADVGDRGETAAHAADDMRRRSARLSARARARAAARCGAARSDGGSSCPPTRSGAPQ